MAAIQSSPMVWSPGTGPKPGRRSPKAREEDADLVSIKDIVLALPKSAWKTIQWREGTAERLSSRFARVRVRLAREAEQWLLIEWPRDTKAATKYWLSNFPQDIAFDKLVDVAKLRWRIERDYQELSRSSVSDITRDAVGAASIITRHSASLPMPPISEREPIPPQDLVPPRRSCKLPFPKVIHQEEPPLRPERHVPNSIATVRRRLATALAERLPRCPCCGRPKFQRRTA